MPVLLPDSIRGSLPYLLSRANLRQIALFNAHMTPFETSTREYAVMLLLEANQALWQSQIAEALALDRTTITYLVDALEAKGRAMRDRDTQDRRAFVVSLTADGRRLLDDIAPVARQARAEMLAPLNADERTQLRALLTRLVAEDA